MAGLWLEAIARALEDPADTERRQAAAEASLARLED